MDQRSRTHLAMRTIQVSQWKPQQLDGLSELLARDKKITDKEEGHVKQAELFQQDCFSSRRLRLRSNLTATDGSRWSWCGSKKSQMF